MKMLDDELRGYEAVARLACAGLADTVTSREFGLMASADDTTWLDIAIVEADSTGDFRQNAELTIEVRITVVARSQDTGRANTLGCWIEAHATRLMLESAALQPLWGDIQERRVEELISNLTSTAIPVFRSTTRIRRRGPFMQYPLTVTGISTVLDGDSATGHAIASTGARIVTWRDPGPAIATAAGTILYAGAELGDDIDVIDASGAVIETLALPTVPTGTLQSSPLPAGEYSLDMAGALSSFPLVVSARP